MDGDTGEHETGATRHGYRRTSGIGQCFTHEHRQPMTIGRWRWIGSLPKGLVAEGETWSVPYFAISRCRRGTVASPLFLFPMEKRGLSLLESRRQSVAALS